MKIILTSAIIAFCGVLQIAADGATLPELRYQLVEKQLTFLNATTALLELQKEILAPDNVVDTSTEFQANLTTLLINATGTIETAGEAAIANGKSVGACVDPALANLTALRKTALAEYAQVGENITLFTRDLLHQTDAALAPAVTVGTQLFTITKICSNDDTDVYAACFADSLKNTTEVFEAYQTSANNFLAAAESETTLESMLELVFEWVLAVVAIAEEAEAGIETTQKTALECIEAL